MLIDYGAARYAALRRRRHTRALRLRSCRHDCRRRHADDDAAFRLFR